MRRLVVKTLTLAALLSGMSFCMGQQGGAPSKHAAEEETPKSKRKIIRVEEEDATAKAAPGKSKLEEMLAEALKNNPDLRVAAAKLAEAEAELNRTRLQVTQKVVAQYYAIDTQKKTVEHQEAKLRRLEQSANSISISEVAEARQALALAKAKLAELEAQMPALLGKTTERSAVRATGYWKYVGESTIERRFQVHTPGPMADKIRKALVSPVSVDFQDHPLPHVLEDLTNSSGLYIKLVEPPEGRINTKITARCEKFPLRSVLQLLEDSVPNYRIVVREYGLLFAPEKSIPPGAMSVDAFLRQKPAETVPQQRDAKNPPAENVEGVVKKVDVSGLMTISIGSDAGLQKGHTLDLFRLAEKASESKYLGTVRVLEVKAKEAVVKPVQGLAGPPQPGDRVGSRVLGN